MKYIAWAVLAAMLLTQGAMAALDLSEIGVGARPLGMGKAFLALADDASAIFTNPAGLAQNKERNFTSMSGTLLGEINYVMFGAAENFPFGKLGLGVVNAGVGDIPIMSLTGSGSTLEAVQTGTTSYNSSLISLAYGSKLSRFLRNKAGDNISLGLDLKFFLQGFSGGGTAMQDATGRGMDADLGLLWEANRWLNLGVNFQNFLPATFGGKFTWQKNSVIEGIPMVTKLGSRIKLIGVTGLRQDPDKSLELMVDYDNNGGLNRPSVFHLGLEYSPLEMLVLRCGVDQKPRAGESGVGVDNNLTAGVGFVVNGFTFDYAYHQYGDLAGNTTNFFSIGYKGEDRVKERAKAKLEKKKPVIPVPEIIAKPEVKTFYDVPDDYWAKKPIEYLATLKVMPGFADKSFKPNQEITRGELLVIMKNAKGPVAAKYLNGGAPNKIVTRGEMAVVMARFCGAYVKPKLSHNPYPDVPKKYWAAPAISATKNLGLFAYIVGKGFGPEIKVTRAEAAEIISKTPPVKKQIEKLISQK
ncbi:MAG: PorV/PorQ family protein [bacterium]